MSDPQQADGVAAQDRARAFQENAEALDESRHKLDESRAHLTKLKEIQEQIWRLHKSNLLQQDLQQDMLRGLV